MPWSSSLSFFFLLSALKARSQHKMSAFAKGEVKVTMKNGKVYEGTYYCKDPVTNTLVIQNKGNKKGYTMLFDGHVKSVEGNIPDKLEDVVPNLDIM